MEKTSSSQPEKTTDPGTKPILIDAANDVTAFASTDASRFVLNGVFMNGKGTEATDGRIVIRVPFVATPHDEFPVIPNVTAEREQVIIPSKVFQEALRSAAKVKSSSPALNCVRISTRKKSEKDASVYAQLATTDLDTNRVLETKCIDGNFPNIDQVFPNDEEDLVVALSPSILRKVVDYADKHASEKAKSITFRFSNSYGKRSDFISALKRIGQLAEKVLLEGADAAKTFSEIQETVDSAIKDSSCSAEALGGVRFSITLADGRKAEGVMMPMRLS